MGYVKERFRETLTVPGVWKVAEYRWKAPKHHFEDIVEKDYPVRRIMGTLCEGCGRVFVPPRFICGRCMRRVTRRVPVSQTGTLTGFLVSPPAAKGKAKFMGMDAVESGILKEGEQIITGLVRWDGTSSAPTLPVINVDPKDVRVGMRVRAVWAEKPTGDMSALLGVEPIPEAEAPRRYKG